MLGQHLVDIKCMMNDVSEADVLYGQTIAWAAAPPILLLAVAACWLSIHKMRIICCPGQIAEVRIRIQISAAVILCAS